MKEYTSSSPVFSESIEIPEATDTNHVNNLNPAPMQLLQNTLLNRKAIENIVNDIASSADAVYQQATGYTDTKIAELINGAPSTLDTLGEIAQAMQDNDNVVDALEAAIGNKAPQAELDGHTGNSTIHITASERTNWDSHMSEKATANSFGHVKLSDTFQNALEDGDAANGVGASQKALADAYSALNSNLADSLGGITFGVDDDGNYGYIKAGADTVTPFSSKIDIPASALGFSVSFTAPYDTSGAPTLSMNFVAMKQFKKYIVTVSSQKVRYRFNGGAEQTATQTFDISNLDTFSIYIYPMNRGSGYVGGVITGEARKS